jgi:hypothetical protein
MKSMDDTFNLLLGWVLGVSLFLLFGIPSAIWAVRRIAHNKRRRLERSKRQIAVVPNEVFSKQKECPHKRSKGRARKAADGQMTSVCRFCGVPMLRHGHGDWEVIGPDAIRSH